MKSLKFAVMALLGLGFAAMAAAQPVDQTPPRPATQAAAPTPVADNGYRVDAGDKVKITVYNEPALTGTFVVDGQGLISMPLIGDVMVKNLTTTEMQRLIEAKLKGDPAKGIEGYVRNPQVSAEMASYRPFYILGEVGRPGEYPFTSGLTVMKAVATAGDFTYRADKKKVFIKHIDDPRETEVQLTPSTMVRPGDTIRIRERWF